MKSESSGRGEPLVLVPGSLTGWLSWRPHAERLAERRRVVRVQLLSVELGLEAEPLPEGYSTKTESQALLAALDELGIGRTDFAAWSYGAQVTLDFALDHPGRVRSLALIEPPEYWLLRDRGPLSKEALSFRELTRSLAVPEVSEAQLRGFLHYAGLVPTGTDPASLPQWPLWLRHRQSLRVADIAMRHQGDSERLRRFDKPVLLFKGESSTADARDIVDLLGQALPGARVVELPGAHALHLESPQPFLAELEAFLQEGDRRPRSAA